MIEHITKNAIRNLMLGLLVWIILGITAGIIVVQLISWPDGTPLWWAHRLLLLALLPVLWFVCIGAHELGHVLAGLLGRFTLRMFTLGPFLGEIIGERWSFRRNNTFNLMGGMAMMLPNSTHRLRGRFLRYVSGGPLASLLLAVLAGWLFTNTGGPSTTFWVQLAAKLLLFTGLISGALFLVSAIPLNAAGLLTDGARFLQLSRNHADGRTDLVVLQTMATLRSGKRPSELDADQLEQVLQSAPPSLFSASLRQYLYLARVDQGELDLAREHLTVLSEQIDLFPPPLRGPIHLEAAFFFAFFEHMPERARTSREKYVPSPLVPVAEVLRTDAALAWCEGRLEEAHLLAAEAIENLPGLLETGKTPLYQSWMQTIIDATEAPPCNTEQEFDV